MFLQFPTGPLLSNFTKQTETKSLNDPYPTNNKRAHTVKINCLSYRYLIDHDDGLTVESPSTAPPRVYNSHRRASFTTDLVI